MKKTVLYTRIYRQAIEDVEREHTESVPDDQDNIESEIRERCLQLGGDYTWYGDGSLHKISFSESAVTATGSPTGYFYRRVVTIETMPHVSDIPAGLSRILRENGFEKQPAKA